MTARMYCVSVKVKHRYVVLRQYRSLKLLSELYISIFELGEDIILQDFICIQEKSEDERMR